MRTYFNLTKAFHRSAEICRRKSVLQHTVRKTINFCMQTQMGNYSSMIFFTHSSSGLRHVCPFFRVAMISSFLHCTPAGIVFNCCISLGLIGFPEYILAHWQRSCSLAEMTSVVNSSVMHVRQNKTATVNFIVVKFLTKRSMHQRINSKTADGS